MRLRAGRASLTGGGKGQAHDPTDSAPLFLGIGTGGRDDFSSDEPPADVVADSPVAADFNVYDRAYEAEIERLKAQRDPHTLYLTNLVDGRARFRNDPGVVEQVDGAGTADNGGQRPGLAESAMPPRPGGGMFASLVTRTIQEAKGRTGP
jgi:[calcium/calmodulin-dependent protein kinase] kinase